MAERRVDFRILQHDRERSLFSIKERSNGELLLLPKLSWSEFGADEVRPLKRSHVTVHLARPHGDPIINGHKIKSTAEDYRGNLTEKSVIVQIKSKGGKFLWPLAFELCSQLDAEIYNPVDKATEIVPLLSYEGMDECLIYVVHVHDKSIKLPRFQGFGNHTVEFKVFAVTIYTSFVRIPPSIVTMHNLHVTGTEIRNGKFVTDQVGIQKPWHVRTIEYEQKTALWCAAVAYFKRISLQPDDKIMTALSDRSLYTRWPTNNTLDGMSYGILSRINFDPIIDSELTKSLPTMKFRG